jgi:hypothetical protein
MGVDLVSVHISTMRPMGMQFMGVYLTDVHLIGVLFTGVRLVGVVSCNRPVPHKRPSPLAHISRACTSLVCIRMYFISVYLMAHISQVCTL